MVVFPPDPGASTKPLTGKRGIIDVLLCGYSYPGSFNGSMVGIYICIFSQQQDKAQCLSQLPPEIAHGAVHFLLACRMQHAFSKQPLSTSISISSSSSGGFTGRDSTSHWQHSSRSQHLECHVASLQTYRAQSWHDSSSTTADNVSPIFDYA